MIWIPYWRSAVGLLKMEISGIDTEQGMCYALRICKHDVVLLDRMYDELDEAQAKAEEVARALETERGV